MAILKRGTMSRTGRGHFYAGTSTRRRHWFLVAALFAAFCCMVWLQVRLWSAASYADMRANIVSAERDPTRSKRPIQNHDEEQRHRATREDVEATQALIASQAIEPIQDAVEGETKLQNLRIVAPLSTRSAIVVSRLDSAVTAAAGSIALVEAPVAVPSFANRHDVVAGYAAAMKYLASYMTPEGSDEQLFLFFVCGDEQGQQKNWRRLCVDASTLVYEVFATSPSRNRLLTIHAGSEQDWSTSNAFFEDGDLKVKMIPAIMQWHGGGPGAKRATSGMIIEESLLYEPLLRYLFKNNDIPDPHLAPEKIASKEIILLKGYKSYRLYMDTIAAGGNSSLTASTGPMFLFFVAGRLKANDRVWCPYCRYSELSVEYAFYAFAPEGARLVKVETVNSYGLWKDRANEWKQDMGLMIRGVPWMYRATFDPNAHTFAYARYHERFDHPDDLRGVFQGWKSPS